MINSYTVTKFVSAGILTGDENSAVTFFANNIFCAMFQFDCLILTVSFEDFINLLIFTAIIVLRHFLISKLNNKANILAIK